MTDEAYRLLRQKQPKGVLKTPGPVAGTLAFLFIDNQTLNLIKAQQVNR